MEILNPVKTKSEIPTAILVLGMHRSGTSALTRIIHQWGAALPSRLIPESASNEAGFWESEEVVALDDELLMLAGSRWDDWRYWSQDQIPASVLQTLRERAQALLAGEFRQSVPFVLKDPRFCRLLPFWRPLLEQAAHQITCALIFRNPLEVAASLKKRDEISLERACLLWLRHVLEAEKETRDLPRVLVRYDNMLASPAAELETLARLLRVPMDAVALEQSAVTLRRDLRHHVHGDAELSERPEIARWVREVWGALTELHGDKAGDDALRRLDQVRVDFNRADGLYVPVVQEVERQRDELLELRPLLRDSEARANALSKRVEEQGRELGRRAGDIQHLGDKVSGLEMELGRRRAAIESLSSKSAALEHQVVHLNAELEVRDAELHGRAQRIEALGQENLRLTREERRAGELAASLQRQRERNLRWARSVAKAAAGYAAMELQRPGLRLHGELLGPRRGRQLWQHAQTLLGEYGFDTEWYLATNPEVDFQGAHPVWHWILKGCQEGRQPNPLFEPQWYLATYGDVREAGIDPLLHYLQNGWAEGRRTSPVQDRIYAWFDGGWYRNQYPDVAGTGMSPLTHYLLCGGFEGRDPGPFFDSDSYLARYPDICQVGINPLLHYLIHGEREGRLAMPPICREVTHPFREDTPGLVSPTSPEAQQMLVDETCLAGAIAHLKSQGPGRFSIIMPTWNRSAVISRAIDSVIRQSWPHWELIICDDGSTDQTAEVVAERYADHLADGRIRYLQLPHNGVSAARNAGLRAATGDWIAYLDSDNLWEPHSLLLTAGEYLKDPKVATTYACLHVQDDASEREFIRCREFDYAELQNRNFIDLNVFTHHRAAYEALGGFDESLTRLVDWDLILRYTAGRAPTMIHRVLAHYFIAPSLGNITLTEPLASNHEEIRRKVAKAQSVRAEKPL